VAVSSTDVTLTARPSFSASACTIAAVSGGEAVRTCRAGTRRCEQQEQEEWPQQQQQHHQQQNQHQQHEQQV